MFWTNDKCFVKPKSAPSIQCYFNFNLELENRALTKLNYSKICNLHLINNRRMFNVGTDDLAIKPYIPDKSLLQ